MRLAREVRLIPKASKFLRSITEADPQLHATTGEQVDRGDILRHAEWMVQREEEDVGIHPNATGTGGNRTEDRKQRRGVTVGGEMVFSHEHVVVAEFLGVDDSLQRSGVHIGEGPFRGIEVSKIVADAEAHCREPPQSRGSAAVTAT